MRTETPPRACWDLGCPEPPPSLWGGVQDTDAAEPDPGPDALSPETSSSPLMVGSCDMNTTQRGGLPAPPGGATVQTLLGRRGPVFRPAASLSEDGGHSMKMSSVGQKTPKCSR